MLLALLLATAWAPPTRVETGVFIAAEVLIAVDFLQSLDIKRHHKMYELNPLMGAHPSDARYIGTWIGLSSAVAAGWWFLRSPWRNAVTVPVVMVEIPVVIGNVYAGLSIRF